MFKSTFSMLLTVTILSISAVLHAQDNNELETDFLSFAQGAIPVAITGKGADLKVSNEQALRAIDGNTAGYIFNPKPGEADTETTIKIALPAATTFQRFTIPNVLETPSPSQTFTKTIVISGSLDGPDDGFATLGSADLEIHAEKNQYTEITASDQIPVKWVNVTLSGGIQIETEKTYFEFSEIIGYGTQEPVPLSTDFTGAWKGRGVLLETKQDGNLVTGCYDKTGDFTGAVTGNILKASGIDRNDGTLSTFILSVLADGSLRGLRSSNGAPFRMYSSQPAPEGTETGCSEPKETTFGCGSIVYGINFAFDSADILPESETVLAELYDSLSNSPETLFSIDGHTSSEGSESYNLDLSNRRAQSVVDHLVAKGIPDTRLSAQGKGETFPIADNDSEAGRSLNRRVEITCGS